MTVNNVGTLLIACTAIDQLGVRVCVKPALQFLIRYRHRIVVYVNGNQRWDDVQGEIRAIFLADVIDVSW